MKSYGSYGINKFSPKILFSTFAVFVLTPLISIVLKVSGVITSVEPIVMFAFGIIGLFSFGLGVYILKEAFLIRQTYIVTKAEVIDNVMSVAGRAIKIKFPHKTEQHIATVIRVHGGKRKGSMLRVLFDPNQPSTVYLYGFKYFFVPVVPIMIGALFSGLAIKYVVG